MPQFPYRLHVLRPPHPLLPVSGAPPPLPNSSIASWPKHKCTISRPSWSPKWDSSPTSTISSASPLSPGYWAVSTTPRPAPQARHSSPVVSASITGVAPDCIYYGITLLIMVVCLVASDLSFGSTPKGVMATLCFFRFWLGIGGDYPLSATIMAEYANKKTHDAFVAAVFAMQGFGILFISIISLIVSTSLIINSKLRRTNRIRRHPQCRRRTMFGV
ncbi:hypothetical protein ACS0TY_011986 [Phlomoides rotata]